MRDVTLICYADDQMRTSQQLCIQSAKEKAGIHYYVDYGPEDVSREQFFYFKNEKILTAQQRGGGYGYWLWKPFICLDVLMLINNGIEDGDSKYVVYADSGVEFIAPIDQLIDQMEKTGQQIFLFGNNHNHLMWCKRKVVEHMFTRWWEVPNITDKKQVQASVIIFKVCDYTVDLVRRWLSWCEIPGFIDDSDNTGVTSHYRDHRNDQAILTNLSITEGLVLHWWPVQYGRVIKHLYPWDDYGQLFYHHRWREEDWKNNNLTIDQFMQQPKI